SRIIRLSYHTPSYVKLAKQAYTAWNLLEEESRKKLIVKTGGVDLWPPNSIIPVTDYTRSLESESVPFEILEAAAIRKRYPQFQLTDDITGLYQADSGIAPAALCNAAHQMMARELGATLLENTPIVNIQCVSDRCFVHTGKETYTCRKLILAGGPWSNAMLAHFGRRLPLTVTQEQVTYFEPVDPAPYHPERFPIWIWMDDPCFYGFPIYGEKGVKVGQDVGGKEVTPETRTYETDHAALTRVQQFMEKHIPGALGRIIYTKSCLYTLTPDRDFVIDTIPENPNCMIAIGAGHAFKFASLIGKILSELAIDGQTGSDISAFKLTRGILNEKNPPKNFMT
ncbi:MAG: FAD-dependent oxidoreductase, partial [Acidobacteriota bacterium]